MSWNVRTSFRPWAIAAVIVFTQHACADVPLEGFIPYVGMGLTNEFADSDQSATFFIAEASNSPGGQSLGIGSAAYYDLALFDTGAATHILTAEATIGFDIDNEGFDGTNIQPVGGATGIINLRINDPHGVYVDGLANRTGAGTALTMTRSSMRGQTSFATLSAPTSWSLPNIVGLPIAAQHAVHIQNSNPQIFQHEGRTVRTPNIEFNDLGSGGQGILRRAQLNLHPGIGFIQGPIYVTNLDLNTLVLYENPLSPSVVQDGGMFLDTDISNDGNAIQDHNFLFDTGASLTVVSSQTAARLGFDPLLDEPDFTLAVEGSGGIEAGIPGFYADDLTLDTVGGSFSLSNVPLAVLDVTNPNDPGNIVDGIIGMNLFVGRDLVIDGNPSLGQGGAPPALYISDPVTTQHGWNSSAPSADWNAASSWTSNAAPDLMCDALVSSLGPGHQQAIIAEDSTIYRATISGTATAEMAVVINANSSLTTFADVTVKQHGRLHLGHPVTALGGAIDAQFVELDGGTLSGSGTLHVGAGPLEGALRNLGGLIAPGDSEGDQIGTIEVMGDLVNEGTIAFDIGGRGVGEFDQITVDRFAFLDGTLQVDLADLGVGQFNPQIGDTFVLINAQEGVQGTFDDLLLPNGYTWNVDYSTNLVRLQVTGLGFVGDMDGDNDLDCADIDLLSSVAATGTNPVSFDLTGDGIVDAEDIEEWVVNLYGTVMGDANLDFSVDVTDFNTWNGSKFTNTSAWCSGNFNGDDVVDTSDFNLWNNNKFTSADQTSAIPEPSGWMLCWGFGLWFARLRRTKPLN